MARRKPKPTNKNTNKSVTFTQDDKNLLAFATNRDEAFSVYVKRLIEQDMESGRKPISDEQEEYIRGLVRDMIKKYGGAFEEEVEDDKPNIEDVLELINNVNSALTDDRDNAVYYD